MQLHFKEYGQGKVVVLLHGLLGSLDNWHTVAQRLGEQFHVFALDQRNHGLSPHASDMDYPLMAGDVNEFFEAHGIKSAFVIGHSMGGKTAMQFALQHPEKVDKLLVEDMAPRVYTPSHDKIFAALLALDLSRYKTRQEIEDALAAEIPSLTLRRFLLKNLARNPDNSMFWKINLRGLAENYSHLGKPISGPHSYSKAVLFIRGGKSNYLTPADEPLIRELFPQAQIETIAEAAHWVHGDKPEEFLRLTLEFLQS